MMMMSMMMTLMMIMMIVMMLMRMMMMKIAGPYFDSHRYFGLMMMMMIGCMYYHIRCHYCSYVFWIDYEQSLAIRKKVYGDEHSTIAASLNNVGTVLSLSGKKDEALVYLEQSLTIYN